MKSSVLFVAALAAVAQAEPIAITGAMVHVTPNETLPNATVVIDGGKIVAIGGDVKIPAGAKVIDGKGKVVTAGFIEGLSSLGLVGVELESSSVDGRFGPKDPVHDDPVHASFEARDGFDARDIGIAVARIGGGITTAIAAPTGGLIAGQSAAFTLDGAAEPVRAPAGMHGAVGFEGAGAAGGSRGKAIQMLRELLDDARVYARDRGGYERNAKRRMIADRLDLEALQSVLAGRLPLVIEAQSEADIRAVLRLATQLKIKVAIVGGTEAWRVADELAKAKVPVIVDPTANLPSSLVASDVHDDAVAVLAKANVPVIISTLGASGSARTLRQLAGNAVAHGMTWPAALAAVTTAPAALFGLDKGGDKRGTLTKGSVADVVVWTGDPFETTSVPETIFIGGVVQPMVSHQTRLLDRYRKLPLAR